MNQSVDQMRWNLQPKVFQLLLTQPISIPRRWARVICRAVAFDREHEPPWLVRVLGDQVDPETRCSHLRYQWNPIGLERVEHLGLELVQRQTSGLDVSEELSVGGRILQVVAQQLDARPGFDL